MAKGKKKKKDLDFQKVKLKVGRKLKKDINETKAEFKSRKIVLREVRSYSDDPITALSRHSDNISQHGKLSMLNHFNSSLTKEIVKSLSKPILDSLSKFILDHSDQVRAATVKCLKTCYNNLKQQHLPTRDFMQSLMPYLSCAYTHVSVAISNDCHRILDYFVNINDPYTFEPLMEIILKRYEAGNLTTDEKTLAIKLKEYYLRHEQKQAIHEILNSDTVEPLVWSEANCIVDLSSTIHDPDANMADLEHEVQLGPVAQKKYISQRYLSIIGNESSPVKKSGRAQRSVKRLRGVGRSAE